MLSKNPPPPTAATTTAAAAMSDNVVASERKSQEDFDQVNLTGLIIQGEFPKIRLVIIDYLKFIKMPKLFQNQPYFVRIPADSLKVTIPGAKKLALPSGNIYYPSHSDEILSVKQNFVIDFIYHSLLDIASKISISETSAWILVDLFIATHLQFINIILKKKELTNFDMTRDVNPDLAVSLFKTILVHILKVKSSNASLILTAQEIALISTVFFREYGQHARLIASLFCVEPNTDLRHISGKTINAPVAFPKQTDSMTETDYIAWVEQTKREAEAAAAQAAENARLEAEALANGGALPGKKGDPKAAAKGQAGKPGQPVKQAPVPVKVPVTAPKTAEKAPEPNPEIIKSQTSLVEDYLKLERKESQLSKTMTQSKSKLSEDKEQLSQSDSPKVTPTIVADATPTVILDIESKRVELRHKWMTLLKQGKIFTKDLMQNLVTEILNLEMQNLAL